MKQKSGFLIVGLLLLYSCSFKSAPVLTEWPHGLIKANEALTFKFLNKIVPEDSLNTWTDAPYVHFMPPIEGRFIWQDTSVLVFSPNEQLPGDTKFKAELNIDLLKKLSGLGQINQPEIVFETESFRMNAAEFFYDRLEDKRTVGVKANLEFTYLVNPDEVIKHMKIMIDGKEYIGAKAMATQKAKIVPIEIGAIPQLEKGQDVAITFDGDLFSPETNTKIKMEKPFTYRLPGIGHLQILGHEFGYDGNKSWITIRASQEIDIKNVKEFVSLEPKRDFTIEKSDGRGFTLKGVFEPGIDFKLTINKGLESVLEAKSENDYETNIIIGDVSPSFRFASESGSYMLLAGERALDIKSTNVSNLIVRVSQVFQNNLLFFLDYGSRYNYEYDYDEDGRYNYSYKYRYTVNDNLGRELGKENIPVKGQKNREATTSFDLKPYLNNGYKGFYVVQVSDSTQKWKSDSKLVILSNIGLIVKKSDQDLTVFAVSLETSKPLAGTTINVISNNNQILASQKTDGSGAARFSNYEEFSKNFSVKLITAELDDDFNFINLESYRVEKSRFEVDGVSEQGHRLDLFLYGDRELYRPGEKIYISGIARNLTETVPPGMPLRIQINNPRGTKVAEMRRILNDENSFEAEYQTSTMDLTGTYSVQVYGGNDTYLASYPFSVEDFVPDRLRIHLNAAKDKAKIGEMITYDLEALNFFGPPASGRTWEFEGSLSAIPYYSEKFADFRFRDDEAKESSSNPTIIKGKTDGDGKANIEWLIPDDAASNGLLRGLAKIAVFDESGRPVYQVASSTIYPKDYYIGIKNRNPYYVSPQTPQEIQIVAVNTEDEPIKGFRAKVQLIRYEWHSVLRMHESTKKLRYISERREITVRTDDITLGGEPQTYTYTVPTSGEYSLHVSRSGGIGYNAFSFYAYAWGATDVTSFKVDPEARIDMVFDKKTYAPGEKAKVLFQTPFDGTMLVTVERNKVLSYQYLDVKDKSASMEISVNDPMVPNVYVGAVLFRKIKEMNIPLLVGHGFAPLMVEKESNKLNVTISAPEKIRPRNKQRITINAGSEKNVYVTLAVVDEGICQVTNYHTPNPYGHFYAKKALGVDTYDFFKSLIAEPEKKSSSGGGEDEDYTKRTNPLGVQRFKPLALWSGILKTDGNGNADVTLDIPEFNGELRLMAIAYKGNRFGSASRAMKVADPVVITPALPRFVSPQDEIVMPITAFNTTDKAVSLKFVIETSGGIAAASATAVLDVGANQERYVDVALKATDQIGKAVVKIRTQVFGETLESATELSVRPTSPYITESVSGFIEGGKNISQSMGDVFLPYGRNAYLTLSPYPVANFAKQLQHLVGYPHGCLEQTASKAFPQIYLRDIAAVLDPSILSKGSPSYFVNEAITKICSLQGSDGDFSYWPGGNSGYTNEWASVYATHFLLEAKKAGYAVSDGVIQKALRSAASIARSKKTVDYYYNTGQQKTEVKRIADKSAIYALYVLALGGSPEVAVMNYYRTEKSLLTTDMKYLLAGAFALSGDRKTFLELIPPVFVTEEAVRTSGECFDSPFRANGLILNVLLDVSPYDPNIPRYAEYLSKAYEMVPWYSTQDAAFTLLALGKMARIATNTKVSGVIKVGDQELLYKGGNQNYPIMPFGKNVNIALEGQGRLYYSIVTAGIRSDGKVKVEDKNLQIRRHITDLSGKELMEGDLASVKQNDLLIVRLDLKSDVAKLENIVITDLLPACFEIENSRLTNTTQYSHIIKPAEAEYIDIRDDRINIYTNMNYTKAQSFYYLVRVVSQGEYRYPPVTAEAMYDGNYYSASGGFVKVKVAR